MKALPGPVVVPGELGQGQIGPVSAQVLPNRGRGIVAAFRVADPVPVEDKALVHAVRGVVRRQRDAFGSGKVVPGVQSQHGAFAGVKLLRYGDLPAEGLRGPGRRRQLGRQRGGQNQPGQPVNRLFHSWFPPN